MVRGKSDENCSVVAAGFVSTALECPCPGYYAATGNTDGIDVRGWLMSEKLDKNPMVCGATGTGVHSHFVANVNDSQHMIDL